MIFRPAIWLPVLLVATAINLVGVGFAAAAAEPWHAGIHAALTLLFGLWAGLWAQRLRLGAVGGDRETRLQALEAEVGTMRRELAETQERLDFTERVLAQGPDPRRVGP